VKKRTDVVVGAVIVLAILLTFLGTVWLKGGSLGREDVLLNVRLREVGQLKEGNTVKLRGVPIGRVERLSLEPDGEGVVVVLRVRREATLPEDPVVLLSPESMFGAWQAEIHPRRRFPTYPYAEAHDSQTLPGYALPDMSRLTAVADEIAQNLAVLSNRVELAFTEETAHNVRKAIENIQQVSEQLTGMVGSQQRAIVEVAANLQQTSEALGSAAAAAERTFARVDASLAQGELETIVGNVARASTQLDSLSNALLGASRDFRTVVGRADTTLQAVEALAARAGRGEGSLGLLLQDSTLYADMVRTNALVQEVLKDFRANPRKYIKMSVF
jgi:phospholipid/cholesterol/gamma-HCH transport system substrate-binding protein